MRFDVPSRPVRVLNLDALARVAVKGSIFDPDYALRIERAAFLRRLDYEVSRPVMPRDEVFGYLPTQVVAEYLAQRRNLDGIIYRSTQSGEARDALGQSSRNIVLFNHAARVGDVSQARLEMEVDLGWSDGEDADDSIMIREKKLPAVRRPKATVENRPFELDVVRLPDEHVDRRPVTLRFVPESLVVHKIRSSNYSVSERNVSHFQYTDADLKRLPF